MRLAVGATRARLARQLLVESLLLGLLGGALGLALTVAAKAALWARRPAIIAENLVEPRIDLTVLAFALGVSVAASLLFGLVPALQASTAVNGALQDAAPAGGGRRRRRWANGLVAAQVAFARVSRRRRVVPARRTTAVQPGPRLRDDAAGQREREPARSRLSAGAGAGVLPHGAPAP